MGMRADGAPRIITQSYVGGKARNMHAVVRHQRIHGRGGVDKTPVVGVKDRASGKVVARPTDDTASDTLTGMATATASMEGRKLPWRELVVAR